MANENSRNYYYDLTPAAEDIDNILIDLAAALEDTGEFDTVKRVKATETERAHFELGEGGGGIANIPSDKYEIIVGDGNDSACGGSRTTPSSGGNGSLFSQVLPVKDGSSDSKNTFYIYGQGSGVGTTDRYIFGNKYFVGSSYYGMPSGGFMMVDGNAFMKAKDGAKLSILDSAEIRIDHSALFTVDNAQADISGSAKFYCQNGGKLYCDNSAEAYFHGGHISVNPIDGSTSSGGGWSKVGKTGGPQIVFHDKAYVNISRGGFLQISDNAHIHAEGSSLLKIDDETEVYFEGNTTFMVTDTAEAYFEDDSRFYMQNNGSVNASPYFCMNGSSAINMNSGAIYGPGIVMDTNKISLSTLCYNSKTQNFNLNCDYTPTENTAYSLKTLIDKIKEGDTFIVDSSHTITAPYTITPEHYNQFGELIKDFGELIGDYGLGIHGNDISDYPWNDTLSYEAQSNNVDYGHRIFYHILNGEFFGRYNEAANYLGESLLTKQIYMFKESAFSNEIWTQLESKLSDFQLKSWYIPLNVYGNLSTELKSHFQFYAYIENKDDYETMRSVLNEYANAYIAAWQEEHPGIEVPAALISAMDAYRNITSEIEEDYFTAGNSAYSAKKDSNNNYNDRILAAITYPSGKSLDNYVEIYNINNDKVSIRRIINKDFIDLRKTAYENKDFYFTSTSVADNPAYEAVYQAAIDGIKDIYPDKVYYTIEGNTTSIIGSTNGYTWIRIGGNGNTQINLLDNSKTENRQGSILSLRGSCQSKTGYIWDDFPYISPSDGSMATLYDHSKFIMRGHWEEQNTEIYKETISITVNNTYNSLRDFYQSNEWQLFLDALEQEGYEFIPTLSGTFSCTEENSIITITFKNFKVKPIDVSFDLHLVNNYNEPIVEVIRDGELRISDMMISANVDPITGKEEIIFKNNLTNESVTLTIAELTYLKSLVPSST